MPPGPKSTLSPTHPDPSCCKVAHGIALDDASASVLNAMLRSAQGRRLVQRKRERGAAKSAARLQAVVRGAQSRSSTRGTLSSARYTHDSGSLVGDGPASQRVEAVGRATQDSVEAPAGAAAVSRRARAATSPALLRNTPLVLGDGVAVQYW